MDKGTCQNEVLGSELFAGQPPNSAYYLSSHSVEWISGPLTSQISRIWYCAFSSITIFKYKLHRARPLGNSPCIWTVPWCGCPYIRWQTMYMWTCKNVSRWKLRIPKGRRHNFDVPQQSSSLILGRKYRWFTWNVWKSSTVHRFGVLGIQWIMHVINLTK